MAKSQLTAHPLAPPASVCARCSITRQERAGDAHYRERFRKELEHDYAEMKAVLVEIGLAK